MNIKSISIIGNEERTLCSHFNLSKAKQIRQQLANSREKRGFLYCYFLDNKKKYDYSVSAYKVVFRSHRCISYQSYHSIPSKINGTVSNLSNEPILLCVLTLGNKLNGT